jgi:predicted Zn-dependent peptidase
MRSGQSPCGLKYAVRHSGKAVAYCALSIGCGTAQEAGFPSGIAHFVEHTLFRGTRRKKASAINSYLDRLGGELNAYTTKEEIVLHATVLKEDLWKAVRLLFELALESTFPDNEIETERGVVLDEIISYKDNPAEDIYDKFEGLLFQGHPLEHPILGTAASVKKISAKQLREFVQTFFTPERMALTIVAGEDEGKLEKQVLKCIEKAFPILSYENNKADAIESDGNGKTFSYAKKKADATDKALDGQENTLSSAKKKADATERVSSCPFSAVFHKVVDKRNHEVNAVVGGYAPSLYQMPDRMVAAMLVNILGGPASNSLLNSELREKKGWVYGIECSYTQYADTGIVAISFGCDRPNLEACMAAIQKILARLRETTLSDARVKSYRKQLMGQLAISSEAGEAQCLSMGKSLLAWGSIMSQEEVRACLENIGPEELRQMACRLFDPGKLSSLVYL